MMSRKVLSIQNGTRFGEWEVLEYACLKGNGRVAYWICKCSCGNVREVAGTSLRAGKSTRCQKCASKDNGKTGLYAQSKKDLYVIESGPYVKIGSSNNPARRIKDIKSSCPYPIKVVSVLTGRGKEEFYWHSLNSKAHHAGEWFYKDSCALPSDEGACEIN